MQKVNLALIVCGFFLCSCHTVRKSQQVVKDKVITESPAVKIKPVDSAEILKLQLAKTINSPLNYTTFYGKAKAFLNSPQASGNAMVYIKMQKDSIIWISITGPLNIEGMRILITPDSIKIMNRLEYTVQVSSITHLQQLTRLPLKFDDFQNIILGRALLQNSDNLLYQFNKDSVNVTSAGSLLTCMYSFAKSNLLLGHGIFQSIGQPAVNSADILFSNYNPGDSIPFPSNRNITVSGSTPASLQLNFKEYNFNRPQSYLFTVSKNYTIKYE